MEAWCHSEVLTEGRFMIGSGAAREAHPVMSLSRCPSHSGMRTRRPTAIVNDLGGQRLVGMNPEHGVFGGGPFRHEQPQLPVRLARHAVGWHHWCQEPWSDRQRLSVIPHPLFSQFPRTRGRPTRLRNSSQSSQALYYKIGG